MERCGQGGLGLTGGGVGEAGGAVISAYLSPYTCLTLNCRRCLGTMNVL